METKSNLIRSDEASRTGTKREGQIVDSGPDFSIASGSFGGNEIAGPWSDRDAWRTTLSGHLTGIDEDGRILFQPEGSSDPPVPVVIGIALSDGAIVKAARLHRRGLVVRTDNGGPQLILVGLLRERVGSEARDADPGALTVTVDGEMIQLEAERQIELRCGKASLLLRRDGRVVLSGTYVVSCSRGPNKIKGATVAIN